MNELKLLTISALLIALVLPINAQTKGLNLKHLGLEQGLSQSTVYNIVQDTQGFMWFGTQDGLNRYDGYSIKIFKHNSEDPSSISDNTIWKLICDHKGNLWIATMRGGVDRYVSSENKFYHYYHRANDNTSISGNEVISIFEDSYGQIWMGTRNNGLNRFNPSKGTFSHFRFNEKDSSTISSNTIWSICEDNEKNLWIGTSEGLSKLKLHKDELPQTTKFIRYRHSPSSAGTLYDNIRCLFIDKKNILWIGTWGGGLNYLDLNTKNNQHHYSTVNSISANSILSVFEDSQNNLWTASYELGLLLFDESKKSYVRYSEDALSFYEDNSGILWVGTISNGVGIYDRNKIRFKHYFDNPDDKKDMDGNDLFSILKDKDGDLWVGSDGSGLNKFSAFGNNASGKKDVYKKIINYKSDLKNTNSLSNNKVYALCQSKFGNIWIGTKGGGLNSFDKSTNRFTHYVHDSKNKNSISSDEIMTLCEDRTGNLWIGNNSGGIDVFERTNRTFKHYYPDNKNDNLNSLSGIAVLSIFEDRRGDIWVGTLQGGLHRYSRKTNSFTRYSLPYANNEGSDASKNTYTVFAIYEDDSGLIWFSTFGTGLNCYNHRNRTFTHYTEKNGLPNNVVYGILPDKSGNLWLSTNRGISRFNVKSKVFRNFDMEDGLQSNEFNQGAFYRASDGEMFFGGINGFNAFYPEEIKDNRFIPPVYITSFRIFDKPLNIADPIPEKKEIRLSYWQNFFSFEFVALNYTSADKNMYSYMLEGFDQDWHTVSARQRFASYTNLDAGTYILHVKASNNDGIWNKEGTSTVIIITPPFWITWWFRILILVLLAAILFSIYRYRINKLMEIERIRSSIAVDLHDDIGSTLTEIALYSDLSLREIRTEEIKHALDEKHYKIESLLESIGLTSRRLIDAMNDIVWAVDPKNDSLEFLLLRMKSQAARMFDAKLINYEIDIPEEISNLKLSLVFRRHLYLIFKEAVNNIIRHAHPNKAVIKIRKSGKHLVMYITDDGKGFDPKAVYAGNGLNNMRKRAKALKGVITFNSERDKQTEIVLTVSLP